MGSTKGLEKFFHLEAMYLASDPAAAGLLSIKGQPARMASVRIRAGKVRIPFALS